VLRCSDCFKRSVADLPEGVKEDEKFDETANVANGTWYARTSPQKRKATRERSR
jgi:hypothetical protein